MTKLFHTITDSQLSARNGQKIEVLGPIPPNTYDFEDVGPMSYIKFPDGVQVEAFDDEIKEAD